ncbi:hypothetical protein R1sor_015217 [Riccia sorocarpa]|uniref:RING-type domain-containing protein n=1 Tax=Riccia sorocarpa TaxID=122646 RepID=A0ABD3HBM5_9MARC
MLTLQEMGGVGSHCRPDHESTSRMVDQSSIRATDRERPRLTYALTGFIADVRNMCSQNRTMRIQRRWARRPTEFLLDEARDFEWWLSRATAAMSLEESSSDMSSEGDHVTLLSSTSTGSGESSLTECEFIDLYFSSEMDLSSELPPVPTSGESFSAVSSSDSPRMSLVALLQQQEDPQRMPLMSLLQQEESETVLLWSARRSTSSSAGPENTSSPESADELTEEPVIIDGEMDHVCCICMVGTKGAAFIPCGHTFCRQCTRKLRRERETCPICNCEIDGVLKIY